MTPAASKNEIQNLDIVLTTSQQTWVDTKSFQRRKTCQETSD